MLSKTTLLVALTAAFASLTSAGCNTSIDTTVGASCSGNDVGTMACANTNTQPVSEVFPLPTVRLMNICEC